MLISDWSSDVCSSDLIKKHPGVAEVYGARLIAEGVIAQGWIDERIKQFTTLFEGEFEAGQSYLPNKADWFAGRWSGLHAPADAETARCSRAASIRSEEHTSELQSLMRISYAVFCLKKKNIKSQ